MTKPFSTERRFETRLGADGSALSMRWRKLVGAV